MIGNADILEKATSRRYGRIVETISIRFHYPRFEVEQLRWNVQCGGCRGAGLSFLQRASEVIVRYEKLGSKEVSLLLTAAAFIKECKLVKGMYARVGMEPRVSEFVGNDYPLEHIRKIGVYRYGFDAVAFDNEALYCVFAFAHGREANRYAEERAQHERIGLAVLCLELRSGLYDFLVCHFVTPITVVVPAFIIPYPHITAIQKMVLNYRRNKYISRQLGSFFPYFFLASSLQVMYAFITASKKASF